jgi:manganese-dependent inorganic pyrophosphatase
MSIYVFGHKNPDTDSIVASIAVANLKNKIGYKCVPKRLGEINKETRFVLDYWNVENIELLENVKVQLKDLDYDKVNPISRTTSIKNAFKEIEKVTTRILPIVDSTRKLEGIVSLKDIAMGLIEEDYYTLDTSIENILGTINGKMQCCMEENIKGRIPFVPSQFDLMENKIELSKDSILILPDVFEMIEKAISNKVKMIIVTGVTILPDRIMEYAKINNVTLITTEFDIYKTSKVLTMSNYISTVMKSKGISKFRDDEYLEDLKEALLTKPSLTFPVVNSKMVYLGFVGRKHVLEPNRKKVILVDHNEFGQSADGIEEADILEIIDHHKIGGIQTSYPITFYNKPLGSTSSIVYEQYLLYKIKPDKKILGLLLSGILSDTLSLTSPTTTEFDRKYVEEISLKLNINYKEFAYKMFKAGTSIEGMDKSKVFFNDYKEFVIENTQIGVSQIFTLDSKEILENKEIYIDFINQMQKEHSQDITVMLVTDILQNGSYLLFSELSESALEIAFGLDCYQGIFIKDLVSRKKQVVPKLIKAIQLIK